MTDRILATLVVILIGVPVAFTGYAVLAKWVLHGPVTDRSLARSVGLEVGLTHGDCRRSHRPGMWRCDLDDGASDSATVYVRVRPRSSCWESRDARSCVHRWQWSLFG